MPETYDQQGNLADPAPAKIALHNAVSIRRELASVYRDMRSGAIETQDGTRLAYVLDMMRKAYEIEQLEKRLDGVEKLLENRK